MRYLEFLRNVSYKFYSFLKNFLKKGSLKNLFALSSILKLIFLYFTVVIYIIIFHFKFHLNLSYLLKPTMKANPLVAIYGVEGRIGEGILHKEIVNVAKAMGWQVISGTFSESLTTYFLTKHFYWASASLLNILLKPEFTLATTHYTYIVPYGFNLVYLNVPTSMLIDYQYRFRKQFNFLYNFDGYVDVNSYTRGNAEWLKKALSYNKYSDNKLIIPAYLSRGKSYYSGSTRQKALITGSLWGCNRDSLRFKIALKRLADEGYIDAIGIAENYKYLGKAYKGLKDGNDIKEMINLLGSYGIGLIIHNLEHIIEAVPTNRIAEVITSGSVVISDKHPFIKRVFGDNVLYFDSMQSEVNIYKQIRDHIIWVRNNKTKAEQMIRNNFNIFNRELALEKVLENILIRVREYRRNK